MPPALTVEIVLTLNVTPAVLEVARVLVGGAGLTEAGAQDITSRLKDSGDNLKAATTKSQPVPAP
jgi:hypothetical protein